PRAQGACGSLSGLPATLADSLSLSVHPFGVGVACAPVNGTSVVPPGPTTKGRSALSFPVMCNVPCLPTFSVPCTTMWKLSWSRQLGGDEMTCGVTVPKIGFTVGCTELLSLADVSDFALLPLPPPPTASAVRM